MVTCKGAVLWSVGAVWKKRDVRETPIRPVSGATSWGQSGQANAGTSTPTLSLADAGTSAPTFSVAHAGTSTATITVGQQLDKTLWPACPDVFTLLGMEKTASFLRGHVTSRKRRNEGYISGKRKTSRPFNEPKLQYSV